MNASTLASKGVTALVALASLVIFTWPLLATSNSATETGFAQTVFMVVMPMLLILLLVQFTASGTDSKILGLLAVLVALNSVIRMLGAGIGGIETAFFLIVITGFVFRTSFGFAMGALSILVSGLLTGGVGPWLPFQMMAAGLVGIGAGLLPKLRTRVLQIVVLASYGFVASYVYGALMTMWNWPYLAGNDSGLSFVPNGGLLTNLEKFWQFQIFTGGLIWDTGRAVTTVALICVTAPALLAALNRAASRAGIKTF